MRRPALDFWWLDAKLGLRMLTKHPGIALSGGLGLAVAVAIAAGSFAVIYGSFLSSSLPLHEAERLVSLEVWDAAANRPEPRILREFQLWRQRLRSVSELGAFRTMTPNLILGGSQPESVRVAALTASGFRIARVAPLLGRFLVDEDERDSAPPVVVIGESVWRSRFASDPAILGRTIQLGASVHAIAGVMPDRFAFPVNHRFWIPLRSGEVSPEPLAGPALHVFGRLAPGSSIDSAQAEIDAIARRDSLRFPKVYARLQPRVLPYTSPFMGIHEYKDAAGLHAIQGIVMTLLVLVCLNVAILVYSRTAMRQAEIAIRSALGASRLRIVSQLFIEAVVLSSVAALAGLAAAEFALQRMAEATAEIASELPFWISFHLSPGAILYSAALSIFAAAIVGIVPALRATRTDVRAGMQLGRTWTFLIVAQVGCAVALLPGAVFQASQSLSSGIAGPGFPAAAYLTAELGMEEPLQPDSEFARRYSRRSSEFLRLLASDPRVSAFTYSAAMPGDERGAVIEIPGVSVPPIPVRFNHIDPAFFRTFDLPLLAGRAFEPSDFDSRAVIVNRSFAQRAFGGAALGRRIRYAAAQTDSAPAPSYEVIGIVPDFPAGVSPNMDDSPLRLYHPAAPGQLRPAALSIRVRASPASFAGPLREIAAGVDPGLHLRHVVPMEEALRKEQWIRRMEAGVLLGVTLSVLALTAAGIYALMSITVSRRRKEIGIRIALGAGRNRVLTGIFSRSFGQLAAGASLGMAAAAAIERGSGLMRGSAPLVLALVALLMIAVGLAAAIGPARRSLQIEPTEALRDQ